MKSGTTKFDENTRMISFETADGDLHGISYMRLTGYKLSKVSPAKSREARDLLKLNFDSTIVEISGDNLSELIEPLSREVISSIRIGIGEGKNPVSISTIAIKDKDA